MHVDGFRFDLASVLVARRVGTAAAEPPVLWDIETDPRARRHQADRRGVGRRRASTRWAASSATRWTEWNGRFRDDVRRFVRGRAGHGGGARDRDLLGSPDLYGDEQREPGAEHQLRHLPRRLHARTTSSPTTASTTRPTARTTATAPTTTRAGTAASRAPATIPPIEALRSRQVKNFLATLLLSPGRPMLVDGRRGPPHPARQQQRLLPGQRDQLARLDAWSSATPTSTASCGGCSPSACARRGSDTQGMTLTSSCRAPHRVARRRARPSPTGATTPTRSPSRSRACTATSGCTEFSTPTGNRSASSCPPPGTRGTWRRWLDTSLTHPRTSSWDEAPHIAEPSYTAQPRSIALLVEQEIQ